MVGSVAFTRIVGFLPFISKTYAYKRPSSGKNTSIELQANKNEGG